MRFRRRASKCSYLLGNGSPQTAPTFSVAPHHPTSSVFAIPAAQLQPLWIKRCARRKSQRPLGGSQRPLGVRILSVLGICILLVAPLPAVGKSIRDGLQSLVKNSFARHTTTRNSEFKKTEIKFVMVKSNSQE